MTYNTLTLAGSAIFLSTTLMILLHAVEWFSIETLSRSPSMREATPAEVFSKLQILKGGLGIETVYYFLLLTALIVLFPVNVVLLTVVAVLGLVHLTAFQAIVSRAHVNWLRKLTAGRVASVLIFDALEVIILLILAFGFYSFFQDLIRV